MRYSKSPVSEVIFGITFPSRFVPINDIFLSYKELSSTYPVLEILPPIADEAMVDFRLATELDPERTGEFLLRLRTPDSKWLVQLQGNKVFVNWIRLDVEDVGNYVGFKSVRQRFEDVISLLSTVTRRDLLSSPKYLELTYHDRIEWQDYVSNLSEADKILRFSPPDIGVPAGFNNIFSKFTYFEERIGGYGTLSINTATSAKNTQLLKFENTLRGLRPELEPNDWYHHAHEIQFEQFERIFSKSLLEEWQ